MVVHCNHPVVCELIGDHHDVYGDHHLEPMLDVMCYIYHPAVSVCYVHLYAIYDVHL